MQFVHNPYAMPLPNSVVRNPPGGFPPVEARGHKEQHPREYEYVGGRPFRRPAPLSQAVIQQQQHTACTPASTLSSTTSSTRRGGRRDVKTVADETGVPIPPEVRQLPNGGFVQKARKKKFGKDMPVCLDYLKGVCHLKRWKCKYAHPPLRLMSRTKPSDAAKRSRRLCEVWLLTGFCKFGETCRDYHPPLDEQALCCAPATTAATPKRGVAAETSSQSDGSEGPYGSDTATASSNDNGSSSPSNASLDQAVRKVNGILNRLTPEKFDTLLQQFFELLHGSEQADLCLQRVLPILFNKAVSERQHVGLYARLTKHLYCLVSADEQLLLQEQLLQLSARLMEVSDVIKVIPRESDQYQKLQCKRLGNMRFIGELVNEELLTLDHLKCYLRRILDHANCRPEPDDEEEHEFGFHLELIATLLSSCGPLLERADGYYLDEQMHLLERVSADHQHRFHAPVRGLQDLRRSRWPKRRDEVPRTLAEIEADFANVRRGSMQSTGSCDAIAAA